MAQTQTIGTHKTQVHISNDFNGSALEVYYHNTRVVFYCNGFITLNTGGWSTATTKLRMNQASNQYNLGYKVYQKDFNWYVEFEGETIPFKENILVMKKGQGKNKYYDRTPNPSY